MTNMEAMQTARRMYEGGWKIEQIRRYLNRHGVKCSWVRVKVWVDEEYAEERRERERDRARRKWRADHNVKSFIVLDAQAREILSRELGTPPPPDFTPELLLTLRVEDGLQYSAIAAVAKRFYGIDMTVDQIRYRLCALGAPKNPNKTRANQARAAGTVAA